MNPRRAEKRWGEFLFLLLVLGLSFLVFAGHPLDSDEGAVLNAAWNLWNGKIMYVDFWEYVPPGSAYLTYGTWKLAGGPSYLSAKIIGISFWILSAIGIVLILRILRLRNLTIAVTVLFWMFACLFYPLINYNPYSSFAAVWLMLFMLRFANRPHAREALVAGLAAGLTFLILQTKGICLIAASGIILLFLTPSPLRKRIIYLAYFLLGFVIPLIPVFTAWSPGTLVHYWFVYPFAGSFLAHSSFSLTILIIEILLTAVIAMRVIQTRSKLFTVLALFQAGLFLSNSHLIDLPHLAVNIFPCLIFLATMIEGPDFPKSTFRKIHGIVLAGFLFFWIGKISIHNMAKPNMYSLERYDASGISVFSLDVLRDAKLIYFGPFMRSLYFEMRKPNPFPETNMLVCAASCQEKTVEILRTMRPEFALLNYEMVERFRYHKDKNAVDQYILSQYQFCGRLEDTSVNLYALEACPDYHDPAQAKTTAESGR
jgi:hypothetical protein